MLDVLPKYKYPEHASWHAMIRRCTNPASEVYNYYGGRGITVCQRWLNSFWDFIEDVGRRPAPGMSLDRINNDGNYVPENVRWATRQQQSENQRNNVKITHQGLTLNVVQWARKLGINPTTIRARLDSGRSDAEALSTCPLPRRAYRLSDITQVQKYRRSRHPAAKSQEPNHT